MAGTWEERAAARSAARRAAEEAARPMWTPPERTDLDEQRIVELAESFTWEADEARRSMACACPGPGGGQTLCGCHQMAEAKGRATGTNCAHCIRHLLWA